MAEKRKKHKKVKVYECKHFKSDTDDFSRWIHCRNSDLPWNQCICENAYARKLCPCFKRVTLNNITWMESLGVEIGKKVKILKSGEIIPKLIEVLD